MLPSFPGGILWIAALRTVIMEGHGQCCRERDTAMEMSEHGRFGMELGRPRLRGVLGAIPRGSCCCHDGAEYFPAIALST